MKKIIIIGICLVIGIMIYQKEEEIIIPSDAIRVRIIANSNNISDLYEKKKLKEEIKKDLYNIIIGAKSSKDADKLIKNNMDMIDKIVSSKTNNYKIDYGMNYFPKKIYKGVLYREGNYNSIIITLGKGLGENWWCVLYPPLCMIEDNDNTSDVEYKSFVLDMLKN